MAQRLPRRALLCSGVSASRLQCWRLRAAWGAVTTGRCQWGKTLDADPDSYARLPKAGTCFTIASLSDTAANVSAGEHRPGPLNVLSSVSSDADAATQTPTTALNGLGLITFVMEGRAGPCRGTTNREAQILDIDFSCFHLRRTAVKLLCCFVHSESGVSSGGTLLHGHPCSASARSATVTPRIFGTVRSTRHA